jgi:aminopeptidase N
MDRWRRYAPALQAKMKLALEKIASRSKLSNDVLEVVSKALAD